ncbi:MAG: EpsI family protein [Verrucomicrobia bacterium]|nr:EpsI family protein [Verrucomicrobiota bacterium]
MITKRLLTVALILVAGMACVFLVPSSSRLQPAGIVLSLPDRIGNDWVGRDVEITERERTGLAADTGFARKLYTNREGDQIFVGIVLSGEDMANSIHRPERCLIAQGWSVNDSQTRQVPVAPGEPPSMEVQRLLHARTVQTTDGKPFNLRDLTYYWFIGTHDRTASHWMRTFYDVRDRVLHGENQRWAYVTIEGRVTEGIGGVRQRNEEEVSRMIEAFIPQVLPSFARPAGSDAADKKSVANL